MAAHDSQRLKARGMIQDPELKSMVGRKGIPKGQHGQAKVGNGQPPVPLAKGGKAGCKMAAGGAAKTRRGIGHGKMPKKGHMAAYD